MAVSGPSPSGARIGRALELLHTPGPRRLRDRNRLAGWAPADRPARRATRTPVPSRAPVPLGRHAERACHAESVQPCAACANAYVHARLRSRGGRRARRSTDEWAGCERGCWRIARPFGNNDGRGRRPVPIGHWHTVRVPSQLPRTAGRREARGACGGGLRGAAHPLRQLAAAAQIGALSAPPRRHGV